MRLGERLDILSKSEYWFRSFVESVQLMKMEEKQGKDLQYFISETNENL